MAMDSTSSSKARRFDAYPEDVKDLSKSLGGLGQRLLGEFRDREIDRQPYEQRWLKDLRQYQGIYEPEIKKNFNANSCQAFMRRTRAKVNTVSDRLIGLLFPGSRDKNWEIEPTPLPSVPDFLRVQAEQAALKQLRDLAQQSGQVAAPEDVTPDMVEQIVQEMAKLSCAAMTKEIDDQLTEGRYREVVKKVVKSGCLYGKGWLKGPAVERRYVKRYEPTPGQGPGGKPTMTYVMKSVPVLKPYFEFAPIWSVYPDMSCSDHQEGSIFQRHQFVKYRLQEFAERSDFNGAAIKEYIKGMPDGDSDWKSWETELKTLKDDEYQQPKKGKRYEVLEYWGWVSGQDLRDAGYEVEDDQLDTEMRANVWLLGPVVIKAVIHPLDGIEWPYYAFDFEPDEQSIFGEGVASILRDLQYLVNAALRGMVDHAAITVGPQVEINVDLLDPEEVIDEIFPFKIWTRYGKGDDAGRPAVRIIEVPSNLEKFVAMIKLFDEYIDEDSTIPRFLQGDSDVGGAGNTMGGLSMLMGAANISLSQLVMSYDDGITSPFIRGMYAWNMTFNDKPGIKGDYEVKARGSSSLMAKEVRAQAIVNTLTASLNPEDTKWVKRGKLWGDLMEAQDLPRDNVRTEDEVRQEEERQLAMQERQFALQQAQAQAQKQAALEDQAAIQQGAAA